jgi:hypothetical protein
MEIKEDVIIEEAKRVTGIIPYRIVALNPTLDELHKLGMTYIKQEPVYTNDKGLRLDFILSNPEGVVIDSVNSGPLTNKFSIFIENNDRIARTGAVRVINDLVQSTWSPGGLDGIRENPGMAWFSQNHNFRIAKVGEEELLVFFRTLHGLSAGSKDTPADEVKFNTSWSAIVGGNLAELRGYVNNIYKAGIGGAFLQGIKLVDGGKIYTTLYTNYFQRSSNKTKTQFTKHLVDYTPTNFDYQNSLEPKFYTESSTPTPEVAQVAKQDW